MTFTERRQVTALEVLYVTSRSPAFSNSVSHLLLCRVVLGRIPAFVQNLEMSCHTYHLLPSCSTRAQPHSTFWVPDVTLEQEPDHRRRLTGFLSGDVKLAIFILLVFSTALNSPTNLWRKNPACRHSPIATLTLTIARIMASHRPQGPTWWNLLQQHDDLVYKALLGVAGRTITWWSFISCDGTSWQVSNRKLTSLTLFKHHPIWNENHSHFLASPSVPPQWPLARLEYWARWTGQTSWLKLQNSASFASPIHGSKANAAIDASAIRSCHPNRTISISSTVTGPHSFQRHKFVISR